MEDLECSVSINTSAAPLDHSEIAFDDADLSKPAEARPPCRVLIVDDDELVRARLSSLLKSFRFDTAVAASAEEALRIMGENPCHVIVTDWQMPDMDGLTLCRHVRNGRKDRYVYLLMLTVRNDKEDILTGLAAGADDYIVKGASVRELLARLEVARRITCVDNSRRTPDRENHRSSSTDSSSGAHNLRYLVEHLPRELGRSQRYGHPLAVLSCEIDEFNLIVERFGPMAGEDVLRAFAARSEGCIRSTSDWLARTGEQEFMIVLPETPVRGAHRVAQKLRQNFAMEPVATRAGPISILVSVGVTAVEPNHELDASARIADMLRAVDRRSSTADLSAFIKLSKAWLGGGNGVN